MKAKREPRIDLANRTRLEEVILLEVPFVVFVDPADVCNFQCKSCPTGNRALMKEMSRNHGLMSFGLYKKIIDEKNILSAGGAVNCPTAFPTILIRMQKHCFVAWSLMPMSDPFFQMITF